MTWEHCWEVIVDGKSYRFSNYKTINTGYVIEFPNGYCGKITVKSLNRENNTACGIVRIKEYEPSGVFRRIMCNWDCYKFGEHGHGCRVNLGPCFILIQGICIHGIWQGEAYADDEWGPGDAVGDRDPYGLTYVLPDDLAIKPLQENNNNWIKQDQLYKFHGCEQSEPRFYNSRDFSVKNCYVAGYISLSR